MYIDLGSKYSSLDLKLDHFDAEVKKAFKQHLKYKQFCFEKINY